VENNNTPTALLNVVTSILSAIIAISDMQEIVSFVAALVAIVSGTFAARHFYYATKKLKKDD
jgi:hypothetical protein